MSNFLRTYTMKCGAKNSKGFEIGNTTNSVEPALHISFSIEKSTTENPNTGKVQVWNLSDTNLKILDTKDCIVELKAGYGSNRPLILIGSVVSVITTIDSADRMTEIEVVDGRVELRDTVITISLNGTVNCKDLYQKVADDMGVSIVYADNLEYPTIPNGFCFVGTAKNALHKIAKCCGHNWSIQNKILQITLQGGAITQKAYLLSSSTGLIGIPKRISIEDTESKKENGNDIKKNSKTGYEIEYLMNGAISVNDIVQIQSKSVNGYFLVRKVTFDGDNLEGDWKCTAQIIGIPARK
nr:MAG TPA: tail protein [Caudoviricetes sp.]DAO80769.1 MAG TPA: tail protein [Caudoviricetes sp.]